MCVAFQLLIDISSTIHHSNDCNNLLFHIRDIEHQIVINRENSEISAFPRLPFISSELLRHIIKLADCILQPIQLSGCIFRCQKLKSYILKNIP